MNLIFLILGGTFLLAAVIDILWTTLWVDGGAGPLSSRLSTAVWRVLQRIGGDHSRVLSLAGPLILIFTLGMWVGLIWAGWVFLFAGGEETLIDTRNGPPVTWTGRFWYVGYTMFTNGNGDFTPDGSLAQIASSLTTASGMLFVTMGVSYILSILGAVSDKRSFAKGVTGIGDRSETFVREGWNGEEFDDLDLTLDTLASEMNSLAEQHKSYPILHYYHSEQAEDASSIAAVIFDEALTILRFGVPKEHRPNPVLLKSARSSTQDYLQTLNKAFIQPADQTPPPPDLDRLRDANIPTRSDDEFEGALADLDERRRKLLGAVEADEWYWPPVKDE